MHRPITAAERLAARTIRIPSDARCILEHTNGSALYAYERAGRLCAIAFEGTSSKPTLHYSYRTEEQRNVAIQNFKLHIEQSVARRSKARTERAAAPNILKIGDILYTSWGYDQTNVDFFAVTKVSGRRVYVRQIAKDYEETASMQGKAWPAMPIRFVGEETWHMSYGDRITIDGHTAHLENGRAHHVSSYA
jgi:hypothetical protein